MLQVSLFTQMEEYYLWIYAFAHHPDIYTDYVPEIKRFKFLNLEKYLRES